MPSGVVGYHHSHAVAAKGNCRSLSLCSNRTGLRHYQTFPQCLGDLSRAGMAEILDVDQSLVRRTNRHAQPHGRVGRTPRCIRSDSYDSGRGRRRRGSRNRMGRTSFRCSAPAIPILTQGVDAPGLSSERSPSSPSRSFVGAPCPSASFLGTARRGASTGGTSPAFRSPSSKRSRR